MWSIALVMVLVRMRRFQIADLVKVEQATVADPLRSERSDQHAQHRRTQSHQLGRQYFIETIEPGKVF